MEKNQVIYLVKLKLQQIFYMRLEETDIFFYPQRW